MSNLNSIQKVARTENMRNRKSTGVDFNVLQGLTLQSIQVLDTEDALWFTTVDGREFEMMHIQECCEGVAIEDICGDLDDLIGTPILVAEEATSHYVDEQGKPSETASKEKDDWEDSQTYTFYHLRTMKGTVTIRWYGESNGYYSESVDFLEVF